MKKNSREIILDILVRVFKDKGFASLLIRHADIASDEAAFVTETVYGTIRNYALLEYQWRCYAKKTDIRTALLLDMSIYQIQYMNSVPDYAAVNEAAALAGRHKTGFVNAVLHKVIDAGIRLPKETDILLSHPKWIFDLFKAHYGEEKALAIMEHDQKPAVVYGRMNTLLSNKQELLDGSFVFLDDICVTYPGSMQRTDAFQTGKVIIQGRSSQAVVQAMPVTAGMRVLDLCAAPGTKTQQIACQMENKGEIIACDLYPQRVHLIDELMEKTGVTIVHTKTADAAVFDETEQEGFDCVLADVPCSGLGDLSHKPEIRWHLQPSDIDALTDTQKKILAAAARYVKQGGWLVYSTCTLNRKENENQIRSFLADHPEYTAEEEKTIFPDDLNSDGFFVCRLRKQAHSGSVRT